MSVPGSYLTLNALKIGRLFVMSTGSAMHGHQIAGAAGVNRQTAYRTLWGMEQTALLSSERETLMDAVATKRPARRLYRMTERGFDVIGTALASLQMAST